MHDDHGEVWTFETLDLHLDLSVERVRELLDQYRTSHGALHQMADKVLDNTAREMSKRLDDMNTWRDQLREQSTNFVSQTEFDGHVNGQAAALSAQVIQLQQETIKITTRAAALTASVSSLNKRSGRVEQTLRKQLSREVYEQQHNALQLRVDILEKWRATVAGRTVVLVAIVGLLGGTFGVLVGHVFR
jgi:hypothetical protein